MFSLFTNHRAIVIRSALNSHSAHQMEPATHTRHHTSVSTAMSLITLDLDCSADSADLTAATVPRVPLANGKPTPTQQRSLHFPTHVERFPSTTRKVYIILCVCVCARCNLEQAFENGFRSSALLSVSLHVVTIDVFGGVARVPHHGYRAQGTHDTQRNICSSGFGRRFRSRNRFAASVLMTRLKSDRPVGFR